MTKKHQYRFGSEYLLRQLPALNKIYARYGLKIALKLVDLDKGKTD